MDFIVCCGLLGLCILGILFLGLSKWAKDHKKARILAMVVLSVLAAAAAAYLAATLLLVEGIQ